MRRRAFLEVMLGSAVGTRVAPTAALGSAQRSAEFRAWTWVQATPQVDAAGWQRRFARIRAAGITGVLASGGDARVLASAAQGEGLAFHRWLHTLYRSGDTWAKRNHPEWFSVSRLGASSLTRPPYVPTYNWLCPTRVPVREYMRGIVDRAARQTGVEGIHLDYIRYIDVILPRGLWAKYDLVQNEEMPQFDFCYCEVCRAAFRAQTGKDPLHLADPAADQEWREFRWNSITELVTLLATAVRARGGEVTAAVFATPTIARKLVRQAWERWPLDAVFPMLYGSFYLEDVPWIAASVREGVGVLPTWRPLYAGLFLSDFNPTTLANAIRAVRDAGAAGISLFSLASLSDARLAVVREALKT